MIAATGVWIILNVGDHWSDLRGKPEAEFSGKYPDPFYFIKERRSGREMGEGKKTGEASQEVELSHRGLMAKLRSLA
jgi:hypothetical protein